MKLCQVSILSSFFLHIGVVNAFSPLGVTSSIPSVVTLSTTASPSRTAAATKTTTKLFQFAADAITVAGAVHSLSGQIVVVKYGGNAMTSPELAKGFCEDIAALQKLGVKVVVVHGGGPQIKSMLEKVGVESRFEGGMRVSSPEVVDVAEMVLCGAVNKQISSGICSAGGTAIGISGRDANVLQCTKLINDDVDLGNVGKVEEVNTKLLQDLLDLGITPVVSPIGTGMDDERDVAYNCNADVAAGRIAGELKASRVLFLTDIAGVLDKEMKLLKELSVEDVEGLIEDETITGGMIPKVTYAMDAIKLGVGFAFITDGRVPHAVINEMLGGGESGAGSGEGGTIITN
mmetsp:Transcript_12539/g.18983  ORF Transcript_12539/g.18983 Transcript_12539/m.18983 type:complete len:346 (-) Transcript_12539:166-1203(-)